MGNYLRVRGEYPREEQLALKRAELPPRARRIPPVNLTVLDLLGTTSACAENTAASYLCLAHDWNYLRVRGEYAKVATIKADMLELPPRARRIPLVRRRFEVTLGTTSACAENTSPWWSGRVWTWNYLRVRGEYGGTGGSGVQGGELPPRARRILAGEAQRRTNQGTTSACAENTMVMWMMSARRRNYLRVRGEYPK